MTALKFIFSLILLVIIAANVWASVEMPIWQATVVGQPWFVATLVDTYLAFFTYWLWVAWLTPGWPMKLLWLLLIFAAGNIAMAAFALIRLWRLPATARIQDFLISRS
jgi:hypothetical protein